MQYIATYATGSYYWLSEMSTEYEYLISDSYQPDALCFCEQGCEDPWLFFEVKKGPQRKYF
jgi:hypothetical protein